MTTSWFLHFHMYGLLGLRPPRITHGRVVSSTRPRSLRYHLNNALHMINSSASKCPPKCIKIPYPRFSGSSIIKWHRVVATLKWISTVIANTKTHRYTYQMKALKLKFPFLAVIRPHRKCLARRRLFYCYIFP